MIKKFSTNKFQLVFLPTLHTGEPRSQRRESRGGGRGGVERPPRGRLRQFQEFGGAILPRNFGQFAGRDQPPCGAGLAAGKVQMAYRSKAHSTVNLLTHLPCLPIIVCKQGGGRP